LREVFGRAIAATIVQGHEVHDRVSFDINPSSRHILQTLADNGYLTELIAAGARTHQPGCNGCIGMGQAPAAGRISLRTVPRNFPGRSGTREDSGYLCSPETAAASAVKGVITDPRELGISYGRIKKPESFSTSIVMFVWPENTDEARSTKLEKTANITSLPDFEPFRSDVNAAVLLQVKNDISTDDIIPAGARVLPLTFASPDDYDRLKQGTTIRIARVADTLKAGRDLKAEIETAGTIILRHTLSKRQIDVLMEGDAINWHKRHSSLSPNRSVWSEHFLSVKTQTSTLARKKI